MVLNLLFVVVIIVFNLSKIIVLGQIPPQIFVSTHKGNYHKLDLHKNTPVDISGRDPYIVFECTNSYPTKWTFDSFDIQHPIASHYGIKDQRTFVDFSNPSTYRYESMLTVYEEAIKLPSQVISCRHVAIPDIYKSIKLKHNTEKNITLVSSANDTSVVSSTRWKNSCPFIFHIHVLGAKKYGYKCEIKPQDKYTRFVKLVNRVQSLELYSTNIVKNPNCIQIVPDTGVERNDFIYWSHSNLHDEEESRVLFCSKEHTIAGVVLFIPTNISNPKEFYVLQRPSEYLDDVIRLEYIKHPVYFVGEEVIVTLNWWKTRYYFSLGDLYITLMKDKEQIYSGTIIYTYLGTKDWTDPDYPNSTLTLDKSLTTFKESGTFVLNIYMPLWNSSKWLNHSDTFIVKDPSTIFFRKSVEYFVFYVGETHRSLECNPGGVGVDGIFFNWNLAFGDKVVNLSSTNQTLHVESEYASIERKYSCTVLFRTGVSKTKHFFVTVKEKDHTITYVVIVAVVLATTILVLFCFGWFWLKNRLRIVVPLSDIKDFENGTELVDAGQHQTISNLPYNKKYEVKRQQIKLESTLLGSGEFGVVYKGGLVALATLDTVEVAVKTVKRNADVAQIKSILNELKVLTFLNNGHPNVLNILGAYTSKLRSGELLVCVELCKDNLLNILRKTRKSGGIVDNAEAESKIHFSEAKVDYYVNNPNECSKEALTHWAYQISDGMEFLQINKVIHGDVAARNILISKDSQVKIADFGLGRVLENYKKYFKHEEALPLPWKWMSIEALVDSNFSTASDVWAFGITTWEIFSLGGNPYPGLQWTLDFPKVLSNGMRLERPELCSVQLYDLLTRCWHTSPTNRPDFAKIKSEIASMLDYNPDYLCLNPSVSD